MTQLRVENFTCPRCRKRADFYIDVLVTVQLSATGVSLACDYCPVSDFTCVCLSCDYEANTSEFTKAVEVHA